MSKNLKIIAGIEALLEELKASLGAPPSEHQKKSTDSKSSEDFSGLTGEIYNLVQEGFFKEPRTLSEIQNKLRLEGVNKPTTSLMKPLVQLIRKKILGRSKPDDGKGTFRYHHR
jgi:hypothetical protein